MSEQTLGSPPEDRSPGEAIFIETPGLDQLRSGRGSVPQEDLRQQDLQQEDLDNARALAQMARDQLARDIADIEHASAALRRAEPALESWTGRSASAPNPRPLWLLIGVLWVSTALVTVGAVVAIAAFAG
jgi:hypothetical protein